MLIHFFSVYKGRHILANGKRFGRFFCEKNKNYSDFKDCSPQNRYLLLLFASPFSSAPQRQRAAR